MVQRLYPGAMTASEATQRLLAFARGKFGLEPKQIVLADSICGDDLNEEQYPAEAHQMVGPFRLGGLNGFPFTGLTGMGALSHHVPKGGAVTIFYGPHIGVRRQGAGAVLRPGQKTASACCGAAQAALGKLDKLKPGKPSTLDYQMGTIEQILLKEKSRIQGAKVPIMEATDVMFEAITKRIQLLVDRTDFQGAPVVLMGGILINGDHPHGSFTQIKAVDIVDTKTGQCSNWLDRYLTFC